MAIGLSPGRDPGKQVAEAICRSVDGAKLVLIHSALNAFGVPGRRIADALLEVIGALASEGTTFLLPSFTPSFCRSGYYHHQQTKSETGVLSQLCLGLDGARRTRHPIYSFTVLGPMAADLFALRTNSAWGRGTLFHCLHKEGGRILMLGSGWNQLTQCHYYEQRERVPYRFYKWFTGTADHGLGSGPAVCQFFARDLRINPIMTFLPVRDFMRRQGWVREIQVNGGLVTSFDEKRLGEAATGLLRQDPWSLVEKNDSPD